MDSLKRWGTVTIVGVGLIGGSIGLALRARGLVDRVVGLGRDAGRLAEAQRLGAIDEGTTHPHAALGMADVAVVCTPVGRIAADVREAAECGPASILVTDAGSTKRAIVAELEAAAATRAVYVGAHPLAGSERSGAPHARAELFEGRVCVLTPTSQTPRDRLERARAFWSALGCRLIELSPEAHDRALALTSHLPHAVAAALTAAVPPELLDFAAGAYRDGTRVAAADAGLWSAIFLANRGPVLDALDAFSSQVAALRSALDAGDEQAVAAWWRAARSRRESFPNH